jgi:hypothetical protein
MAAPGRSAWHGQRLSEKACKGVKIIGVMVFIWLLLSGHDRSVSILDGAILRTASFDVVRMFAGNVGRSGGSINREEYSRPCGGLRCGLEAKAETLPCWNVFCVRLCLKIPVLCANARDGCCS